MLMNMLVSMNIDIWDLILDFLENPPCPAPFLALLQLVFIIKSNQNKNDENWLFFIIFYRHLVYFDSPLFSPYNCSYPLPFFQISLLLFRSQEQSFEFANLQTFELTLCIVNYAYLLKGKLSYISYFWGFFSKIFILFHTFFDKILSYFYTYDS